MSQLHPDEMRAQDAVVARLSALFPDVPGAQVRDAVTKGYERYAEARVRDYVELLVEREVAEEMRASAARQYGGSARGR